MLIVYPITFYTYLGTLCYQILAISLNRINNNIYNLINIKPLNLLDKEYDVNNNYTLFTFENNKLLDHKNLFVALFSGLMLEDEFKKVGKKIIIVSIHRPDKTFYIHKNIIIDENTTINLYLEKIERHIQAFYDSGYPIDTFHYLEVKMWDLLPKSSYGNFKHKSQIPTIHQSRRNYHLSNINRSSFNSIKPLKKIKKLKKINIAAIDIESIDLMNKQVPISISFSYYLNNQLHTIFELIDYNLLKKDSNKAIKLLFNNFMNNLYRTRLDNCVIFAHNLGNFDGYFIYKGLLELPNIDINDVKCIFDKLHKFITIDKNIGKFKYVFKDSLRVFPVSLNELTKVFEVESKLSKYNQKFNNINMFEDPKLLNQFIKYSQQDTVSLLLALIKAQDIYIKDHQVDIASIVSTSTLSFKIFRQNFLKIDLPILDNKLDKDIRLAYLGGSSDYYLKYGKNLKHYDVNSLYPLAMCKPMPVTFLGESYGPNIKLEEVFGFIEAKITTPKDLKYPLLAYKHNFETIHPSGSWVGVYFSEELKMVAKYGYQIEIVKVYHFSKEDLFTDYINYFYDIKKNSKGAERYIAKMHLNQLYGYFGRRKTLLETVNVYKKDLQKYYGKYTVYAEIDINKDISTLLISSNLDYDLLNEINYELKEPLKCNYRKVNSHVGVMFHHSAVTSILK
jgi:hypothetical protein